MNIKFPRLDTVKIIYGTLTWSKALMPVLALCAGIASAIRTIMAVTESYTASGVPAWAVVIASVVITLVIEGALFALALIQESQQIKWRLARKKRHVTSLKSIWYSVLVRVGVREPLSHDQLPEGDGFVGILIWIVFATAIVTNLAIGLKPLMDTTGTSSVQTFLGYILNANAGQQLTFAVDLALALFPPFMEFAAGHKTAQFAAEVSKRQTVEQPTKRRAERKVEQPKERSKPRSMNASERVIEHLNAHPEDRALSRRELAELTGASVGTVQGVLSKNGNGNHRNTED